MKTPQTNDSLAKAIAYLGAVEVAPGRYAAKIFDSSATGRWHLFPAERLKAIACDMDDPRVLWWPALRSVEMPAWWSPDQRFAWRDAKGFMYFHAERAKAYNATERITADLTTGAEVPA